MSRCVIKKAVVAASLGLAMFVTNSAYAQLIGTDELVLTCAAVSDVAIEVKGDYSTLPSTEVELHPQLKSGFDCMKTLKFLKEQGFVKSSEAYFAGFTAVSTEFPMEATMTGRVTATQTNRPSVPLVIVIRFECADIGSCLTVSPPP